MQVSGILYLLEQTLGALAILLSTGYVAGRRRPLWPRLLLTSVLCGLLAMAAGIYPLLRLTALGLMLMAPWAAWPGTPQPLRLPLITLGTGLLLAGCIRFVHTLLPLGWLCVLLCCVLLPPLLRRSSSRPLPRCATVEIRKAEHRLTLPALIDSGNLLRDPISGLPVIVIPRRAALRLTALDQPDACPVRCISVRTVTGASLMAVFRPDAVRLEVDGAWILTRAIIGLAPEGYEGAQALIPACLTLRDVPAAELSQGG